MHPNHGYQMLNGVRRHRARVMFGSMKGFLLFWRWPKRSV
ncbi:hypothetical protein SAMN04488094_11517 [Tropicimonas isoalkanivorans]|uniref:Uncharacterized protein n=1 Tax=Tropicimonas isoalkanivorans TaxID=441112 RepID=A0A1I1PH66_9RHOB|nr:hypothetical protein SAMN04488094_11517 [Tropicimonas isoalkanivorans]